MVSFPIPGQANTVSTITAPPSRNGSERPSSVMMGIIALRMACLPMTRVSLSPFARAVRM